MTNELQVVTTKSTDLISFDDTQVGLIKRQVAVGATDDELAMFLHQCRRTGLDPIGKQIYFQKRKNYKTGADTVSITTGIDGYRLVAERTGRYAGNDDPIYDREDERPNKATVTVYKMVDGVRCPFEASARWSEYYPGDAQGFMWKKMPFLMLGKVAEALALRKAFPAELSGMHVKEEMDQAHDEETAPSQATADKLKERFSPPKEPEVVDAEFEEPVATKPDKKRLETMLEAFADLNVSLKQILHHVGKKTVEEIDLNDMTKLKTFYTECMAREGDSF